MRVNVCSIIHFWDGQVVDRYLFIYNIFTPPFSLKGPKVDFKKPVQKNKEHKIIKQTIH